MTVYCNSVEYALSWTWSLSKQQTKKTDIQCRLPCACHAPSIEVDLCYHWIQQVPWWWQKSPPGLKMHQQKGCHVPVSSRVFRDVLIVSHCQLLWFTMIYYDLTMLHHVSTPPSLIFSGGQKRWLSMGKTPKSLVCHLQWFLVHWRSCHREWVTWWQIIATSGHPKRWRSRGIPPPNPLNSVLSRSYDNLHRCCESYTFFAIAMLMRNARAVMHELYKEEKRLLRWLIVRVTHCHGKNMYQLRGYIMMINDVYMDLLLVVGQDG